MNMTKGDEDRMIAAISSGLDRAERNWDQVSSEMVKKSMMIEIAQDSAVMPSQIPGHSLVSEHPTIDEFIAMVVDMRKSSERLKTCVNSRNISDGFQRVYYETSALLPAISVVTSFHEGVVTEYLGDGALALFQVDKDDKDQTIRKAYRAATQCVQRMRELINSELHKRYNLPPIQLGVGMSISKAMVTLVGSEDNPHPKAIGECVWEATKLSGETNVIMISKNLYSQWPSSKNGKLGFSLRPGRGGINGYRIN